MDSRAKRLVRIALEAGIPVVTTGPPGIGKTGHFYALEGSSILGRVVKVVPFMLSVREAAEIGGFPAPNFDDGVVDLLPVRAFKEANRLAEEGFFVILFLDEIRTITESQQAAAMKAVHEGVAGDITLNPWVRRAAAANSVAESAGGIPMAPPMANRWMHVFTSVNATEWAEEMRLNSFRMQSPLSEQAQLRLPQERALVATYISRKPGSLLSVPKDEDERDGPWPSPRTWDYVAHLWAAFGDGSMEVREELMAGCVGLAQASQFIAWRNAFDLPDPEKLIDGSFKGELVDEDRPDRTYTIMSSLVSVLADNWTPDRYKRVWQLHAEVSKKGAGDIAAATINTLMRTTKDRDNVPSIAEWAQGFADFLRRAGWTPV